MASDAKPGSNGPSARLVTTFGTGLYVDPASGELRHGTAGTSPGNAVFVADVEPPSGRREGWLVHETADACEPVVCGAEASWSASRAEWHGVAAPPTRLTLVQLERGLVALRSGELYLCAEASGKVTLSRHRVSGWEAFLPSEAWCTAPLSAQEEREQAALAATVDWKSIAALTIDAAAPSGTPDPKSSTRKRLVVAVYTIALNEVAHVERWANSAADADYRIVADTGSTDGTIALLEQAGVTVHRIAVRPWRFDDARNAAMALVPADVDVCCTMDMDMFLEPGWRAKLEATWTDETTALDNQFVWLAGVDDPTPLRRYTARNFHARWGYRFKRPVHEHLIFAGNEVKNASDIVINHIRSSGGDNKRYLNLMERSIKEDPNDGQVYFWLARDCLSADREQRAIELLQQYLELPSSTWPVERSEAMRFLARLLPEKRLFWLDNARAETPYRREVWLDLAEEFHQRGEWVNLLWACTNGLEGTRRTRSYLDEEHCWTGPRLFELGAVACRHLNIADRAIEWGRKAIELDPTNQRLRDDFDAYAGQRKELSTVA